MAINEKPDGPRRDEQQRRNEQRHNYDKQSEKKYYDEGNGWVEYRRLILSELERINLALREIDEKIDGKLIGEVAKLKVDIGMLQVRSGIWGAIAGVVTTVSFILAALLGGKGILGGH